MLLSLTGLRFVRKGEQIGIRYGEVGEIEDAYRNQVVKSAMAVIQPGERAVFYTFALK